MLRWKENHYARAETFAHLVAEALGGPPAPAPQPGAIVPPPPPAPAKLPAPAAPTAAAVFKNIPWKK